MEEPSLLDFIKSKLAFWKASDSQMPERISNGQSIDTQLIAEDSQRSLTTDELEAQTEIRIQLSAEGAVGRVPWRVLAAVGLAFAGQYALSPEPDRDWRLGSVMLVIAFLLLSWSLLRHEVKLTDFPKSKPDHPKLILSYPNLILGAALAIAAFFSFGRLEFSSLNLLLLLLAVWFTIRGFTSQDLDWLSNIPHIFSQRLRHAWNIQISLSTLIGFTGIAWVVFFRFFRLAEVPPEMNSDHAEKFLDIIRVLEGQNLIFFSNNGGREALQFYIAAGLHRFMGLPLDFMILKIITSLVGFLALPFIYLLGKELGGVRVGLLAFLFAGIAYWPNVVARVGLRLPFYMFFSAVLLYFLVRGLRQAKRDNIILAGLFLGLSFYGYSADRILPLIVILVIALYLLHVRNRRDWLFALTSLLIIIAVSLVVFVPLLRYIIAEPQSFFLRTLTRMSSWEKPIQSPAIEIFLANNLQAFSMFSWDAGVVWPISMPGYPALSTISGGLFYIGLGLVFFRYLKEHHWIDLMLLLSIPVFLLPSTFAIAFPSENPNLYRTGGAIVPVMILIAFAADALMKTIEENFSNQWGSRLAAVLITFLLLINSVQDYNLVFERYYQNYKVSSWNSSEMGTVARSFINLHRKPENVWVIGYPNWVDTRLVANNAGIPGYDFELKTERIGDTAEIPGAKLFFLNLQDAKGLEALKATYPQGLLDIYPSRVENKDFLIFYTYPATE